MYRYVRTSVETRCLKSSSVHFFFETGSSLTFELTVLAIFSAKPYGSSCLCLPPQHDQDCRCLSPHPASHVGARDSDPGPRDYTTATSPTEPAPKFLIRGFGDRFFLCSPNWPQTHDPPILASQLTKRFPNLHHHTH